MGLALKDEKRRAAFHTLRHYLTSGERDEDIAIEMGLSWNEFEDLKIRFFEFEAETVRKRSTGDTFTEYVLAQQRNLKDLDDIILHFQRYGQVSAASPAVAAIRAKSEIIDKVISKGQEFGLIAKVPEQKIIAGTVVHQLSNAQLRQAIKSEVEQLEQLTKRLGAGSGTGSIIDIDPGPLHGDDPPELPLPLARDAAKASIPAPPVKVARPKRHARTKVQKGRKLVKAKKRTG